MYSELFDKIFVFGLGGLCGAIILGALGLFINTLLPFALVMFLVFGSIAVVSWLIDSIMYLIQ